MNNVSSSVYLKGKCHCGNISYTLHWPAGEGEIPVRACSCTFCSKHGAAWTSICDSALYVVIRDESELSKYKFGTGTADFFVCSGCGVVPLVVSKIAGHLYAVVNVNTLEAIDPSRFVRTVTDFDGEDTGSRLERRQRSWIQSVRISAPDT